MKPQDKVDFTVEEIRRAAETCPDFKRIMKTLKPEVFEEEVKYDQLNIYAISSGEDICKLHRVKDNQFAFICMENSESYWNGTFKTARECIEHTLKGHKIHTFTSQEEFVRWCAKELGIC